MAHNIEGHDLVRFMRQLYDLNTDFFGCMNPVQQDRVQRWMDAVLPPAPRFEDIPELKKAAE